MDDFRPPISGFADLIVGYAANVQPGQVVAVLSEPGKEDLTRAVAAAAYRRGAKFVDVWYFDQLVKRERIEHAAEDTLDYVPPWWGERLLALGELGASRIALNGPAAPGALDDLDPARAGRDRCRRSGGRHGRQRPLDELDRRARPDAGLGRGCAPGPGARRPRYRKLWEQIVHVCRLDEPDPVAAWAERTAELNGAAERLRALDLDALHFDGPGTDLTVGLLPTHSWLSARVHARRRPAPPRTSRRRRSSPRPTRSASTASSARRCRSSTSGSIIRGIEVRFEGGRAVSIEAEQGADVLQRPPHATPGASRLGEVALVDRAGPHRAARHRLLRHAAGRERREPHRARLGLHVRDRRVRLARGERRATSTSTS